MATVLVVDDSVVDRHQVGAFLEKGTGLAPVFAAHGDEALAVLCRQRPDVVITDLYMPGLSGLELVEAIRARWPGLPVILITAYGSEDVALQCLQRGAAGYVPKRHLCRDLRATVAKVLELAQAARAQQRVLECLTSTESQFRLDNDPGLLRSLVRHLRDLLAGMNVCDDNDLLRVSVALGEALTNASDHGNLEVRSDLRETDTRAYTDLLGERRQRPPYQDRHVHVSVRQTRQEVAYVIRDEGPGFDPSTLPDPTDPANLERASGRGLLLIRTFVDDVRHNARGNEITLVKRLAVLGR